MKRPSLLGGQAKLPVVRPVQLSHEWPELSALPERLDLFQASQVLSGWCTRRGTRGIRCVGVCCLPTLVGGGPRD